MMPRMIHRFAILPCLCLGLFVSAAPPATQPASEPATKESHPGTFAGDKLVVTHPESEIR